MQHDIMSFRNPILKKKCEQEQVFYRTTRDLNRRAPSLTPPESRKRPPEINKPSQIHNAFRYRSAWGSQPFESAAGTLGFTGSELVKSAEHTGELCSASKT